MVFPEAQLFRCSRHRVSAYCSDDSRPPHSPKFNSGRDNPWAQGVTDCEVTLTVKGRRGGTLQLFPRLSENYSLSGMKTGQADAESMAAIHLVQAYTDLMTDLEGRVAWKAIRNDYRESLPVGRDQLVAEVAQQIRPAVDNFCKRASLSRADLFTENVMTQIVRRGLEERKGGNPRERIAQEILSIPTLVIGGVERKASAKLIGTTLRALRRYGTTLWPRKTNTRRPRSL